MDSYNNYFEWISAAYDETHNKALKSINSSIVKKENELLNDSINKTLNLDSIVTLKDEEDDINV